MKKIKLMFSLLFLFTLIIGCSNPYETYQKAHEKTSEIQTGKTSIALQLTAENLELPFNRLDIEQAYDQTEDKSKSSIFIDLDSYGVEATLYQHQGAMYVVSPLLPKILVVNDGDFEQSLENEYTEIAPSIELDEELLNQIRALWYELITSENISELGNVIVTTPDGDVKGKEYKVIMTNEKVMPVLSKTIELFMDSHSDLLQDMNVTDYDEFLEDMEFDTISFYAYLDRDDRIIEERFTFDVTVAEGYTMNIDFQLQRWDMGKSVDIKLPTVTNDNVMSYEELSNFRNNREGGE